MMSMFRSISARPSNRRPTLTQRTALHQPADRIVDECQQRAGLAAILEPGVLRAVDLHQFTQTIPPPGRLVRRGQPMTAANPQSVGNHPTA
jgi:hypothetical protein